MLENIASEPIEDSILKKPENNSFIKRISGYAKKTAYNALIWSAYVAGGLSLAAIQGCNSDISLRAGGPNANVAPPRIGSYASATLGTNFLSLGDLGDHASLSEKNGIVYTAKGGHIDIAHLRKAIDLTMIYAVKFFESIKRSETKFSFPIREGSYFFVEIDYPENWNTLSQNDRKQITQDISVKVGEYLSFNVLTWHEIITWYGYKCTGIYSEFPSAFSWEETYSHVLGTDIGAYALKKTGFPVDKDEFNNTVTLALRKELICLGIQSKETARYASEKVKEKWWSGGLLLFVDIKKRNFDIGLDDGYITPVLVPSICEGAEPEPLAVPTKDILSEYDFSIKCKIDPRVWEKDEILAVLNPGGIKIIDVEENYPEIMESIEEEAVKKYGYDVGAACSR